MTHIYKKANLSLKSDLFLWLDGIRQRLDARSVPDVIRMLLKLMRQATADAVTAGVMIEYIQSLTIKEQDSDELDIIFSEFEEEQRRQITQGYNLNQRV